MKKETSLKQQKRKKTKKINSEKVKKKVNGQQDAFKMPKIKVKIVGLGGGGSSIVSEIARKINNSSFLMADTDYRVLKKKHSRVQVFHFGKEITGQMGTGMNLELAKKAAENEKDKIEKIFKDQNISILIICLGGGVGSGAGPVFAKAAGSQKQISIGILTLPFSFEGEKKAKIARRSLEEISQNLSGTIVIPNEKIFQIVDKKTPLKKALSQLNQILIEWLGQVMEMISKPGLINIDFADLKSTLKGQGKKLVVRQITARGPNKAEEIIKKISQNVIFDSFPKEIKHILFNITGGKDLELREVEEISRAISKINRKAKIIFGISYSPKYKGAIKINLIATGDQEKKEEEKRKGQGIKKILKKGEKTAKKAAKKKPAKVVKKERTKGKAKRKPKKKTKKQAKRNKTKEAKNKRRTLIPVARKKKIRRSALEIKKAEKETKELGLTPEPEWEIPSFLRKK